jgi:hypothetical protein
MVTVTQGAGQLHVTLRQIVTPDDMRRGASTARGYWARRNVRALVVDIRGCKALDRDTCQAMGEFLRAARSQGVANFYRIGRGSLCALQMSAVEEAAIDVDVEVLTEQSPCSSRLPGVGGAAAPHVA